MFKFLVLVCSVLMISGCRDDVSTGAGDSDSTYSDEDTITGEVEAEVELGVYVEDDCSQWVGDTVCNLVLKDQDDEYWELYEHSGKPIVLDFSTMWCAPCNAAADVSEQIHSDYSAYDLEYVTVLVQDKEGNEPDLDDLATWIKDHNIENSSVLQGIWEIVDYSADDGYPLVSWPTFVFITRDMIIHKGLYGWNEKTVRGYIEEII